MNKACLPGLLDHYQSGWSLEQPFYTSTEVFEAEWKHIWRKYWLFAGTVADIPKPGDFFTYKVHTDSIIIIRGNNGEVFAHYNTCRHRGSLICLEEAGHAAKLICPYHQWVFDKDGRLLKARLMPDDFDKATHSLHPVKVEVVEGFIFISLNDNPPDFAAVAKDYASFLKPYQLQSSKVAFKKRYELRTNWKLVAENFRECYHCGPAHPEYCSAVIGANLREPVEEVLTERRVAWKGKGLATDNIDFTADSFHFAVRYPLRPGVSSYSLDGKPVAKPMGQHQDYDAGVLGLVVYPNFWMDAVSDYMWTMRLTAVSPSCTIIDLTWLVDNNAVEGIDYETSRLTEFWKITGEQDWELCENNFSGIESSHYQPGPYAPVELDVAKFVDWYIARMREATVCTHF
ncbi:aromatic ring-hydroxylating oxygenase subunit alpha [Foetidibacter luteolus]|uniref:aromatic ring-hydroxylating oxygenase subunit alpha n=1 Tax=Foetidibacter luteolus TaxID=2608880 RepID=UPI001A9808FE|nr:aromatic ring-hydroxylating dioxygenase subunit alpha [Foetidibacter luteolus]